MSTKKITLAIIVVGFSFVLIFIPANNFFGLIPSDQKSPSPFMILQSDDEIMSGFKIIPLSCKESEQGLTESAFQITNNHEKDYEVNLGISFTDNDGILEEKEITIKILSGETVNQIHLSGDVYENPICVVQINDWLEI